MGEKQGLHQAVYEASPDMIFILDGSGSLVDMNDNAIEAFGMRRKEFPQEGFGRLIGSGLSATEMLDAVACALSGKPVYLESKARRHGGEEFPVEIRLRSLPMEPGTPERRKQVVALVRDISAPMSSEDDLRASEAKYRKLLEQASAGIGVLDVGGRFLDVNSMVCEITGHGRRELLNMRIRDLTPREEAEKPALPMEEILRGGHVLIERRWKKKDGSLVSVEISAGSLWDGNVQVIVRDISQRRRGEEALRASEERYRSLVQCSKDAILQLSLDGAVVYASPSCQEIWGYESSDLKEDREFLLHMLHPISRDRYREFWQKYRSAGRLPLEILELTWIRKDGRHVHTETQYGTIRDARGRITGFQAVFRDVTARIRAERELRASEGRYRQIFDGIAEGIYRSTPDGSFVFVNPAMVRMLGYDSLDETLKRDLNREGYVNPEERIRFMDLMEKDGEVREFTSLWKRKDGSTLVVRENARAVRNESGRIAYYDGTVEDITEAQRSREKLERSEKKYRTLLENIQDGVFVVQAYRLIFANDAAEAMTGYAAGEGELVGMDFRRFIAPEDLELVSGRYHQRISGEDVPKEYVIHLLHKDGVTRVAVNMTVSLFPLGESIATLGVIKNITESQRMERELRRTAEELQAIFKALPDLYFRMDSSGVILDCKAGNNEDLYAPMESFLGKPMAMVVPPHVGEAAVGAIRKVLETGIREIIEYSLQMEGGERFFECRIMPLSNNQVISVVRNITERKRIENDLRKRNRELLGLVASAQAMVEFLDLPSTAKAICDAALAAFEMAMVWIGVIVPESTEILPLASSGRDDGYTDKVRVHWDESDRSKGPGGRAVKSRKPVSMHADDGDFAPWREEAEKRGYRSVCALPLVHDDAVRGVILMYSSDGSAFEDGVPEAMEVFAGQATMAIVNSDLYTEARSTIHQLEGLNVELRRTKEELERRNLYFREFFKGVPETLVVLDGEDRVLEVNPAFESLFGILSEQAVGKRLKEFIVFDEDGAPWRDTDVGRPIGSEGIQTELEGRRGDESTVRLSALWAPIRVKGRRVVNLLILRAK